MDRNLGRDHDSAIKFFPYDYVIVQILVQKIIIHYWHPSTQATAHIRTLMPRKSKKAHLAEAQRASGTQFFDAGFPDTKHINDPSYNTFEDHDIDQSDSNEGS